ncbi:unnamed protein product [Cylicostephanus goldi]|uniref:L-type lectin-like domain-containing protein n=1 Tax=Cylicostephanus goldi TaxID=71465 RepID=A0A3P6RIN0_CYLGO|nr:unnamed protein product [Cylicostephanus goldi]
MGWPWGFLILTIGLANSQQPVFRKFEYKHSFRAPNLAQRDGSIPFWMVSGVFSQFNWDCVCCMRLARAHSAVKTSSAITEQQQAISFVHLCIMRWKIDRIVVLDTTRNKTANRNYRASGETIQVSGDAIASGEQLRLAPSMRSRKGIVWNKRPMQESENFQVDVSLKVAGQGRIGADGMAIWYTAQMGSIGPVFGANDFWTGMGIFMDSFDNDGQKNNPIIALMINDGTRSYDHQTDGSQQILASCQRDFRNKPYPVHLRIEYLKNVLTVYVDDGMQQTPRFELCMRAENILLPRNGHFGMSAATGGLAGTSFPFIFDASERLLHDHDVLDFSVFSIQTDARASTPTAIPQDEKSKYDEEFKKQMEEYEAEKAK